MSEPRIFVSASDLLELIEQRDAWKGSLHPDEHEEYLARFAELKRKALDRLGAYQQTLDPPPAVEDRLERAYLRQLMGSRRWVLVPENARGTYLSVGNFDTRREALAYANEQNIALIK